MARVNTLLSCPRIARFLTIGSLPPANEVWGKVIFLHLFVILFTGGACVVAPGGRGACMVVPGDMCCCSGGCVWLLGGEVCVVARGACVVARGVCMVALGGHAWLFWGGMHGCSGGHAWLLWGGMCGCSGGICMHGI